MLSVEKDTDHKIERDTQYKNQIITHFIIAYNLPFH